MIGSRPPKRRGEPLHIGSRPSRSNGGWRYRSHADVNRVVGRLARDMQEPRLNTLVSVAHSLHQNYYEDAMPEELIQHNIDDMREMLDTLARAA